MAASSTLMANPMFAYQYQTYAQGVTLSGATVATNAMDWATTSNGTGLGLNIEQNGTSLFDHLNPKPKPITNFSKWLEKKYGTK